MIWKSIFGRSAENDVPYEMYRLLVGQARSPQFYLHVGVPDTPEGRFEMVAMHVFLLLRRLRGEGEAGKAFGQKIFDLLFDDMDQTLREMGVGDLSVGKKIKALASSFYGRIRVYEEGLEDTDDGQLKAAIRRNVYAEADVPEAYVVGLISYMRRMDDALSVQDSKNILTGKIEFVPPLDPAQVITPIEGNR